MFEIDLKTFQSKLAKLLALEAVLFLFLFLFFLSFYFITLTILPLGSINVFSNSLFVSYFISKTYAFTEC